MDLGRNFLLSLHEEVFVPFSFNFGEVKMSEVEEWGRDLVLEKQAGKFGTGKC